MTVEKRLAKIGPEGKSGKGIIPATSSARLAMFEQLENLLQYTPEASMLIARARQAIVESAVWDIMIAMGVDERPGMQDTPARVARMFVQEYTPSSIKEQVARHLGRSFEEPNNSMVIVRDIPFGSLCEHHLVAFYGTVDIGYIPNGKVVGLSKLPRAVQIIAGQPSVQERIGADVADAIVEHVDPKGVIVVMHATHACMCVRGIRSYGASTTTSSVRGVFETDAAARAEFLALIKQS
jgi:GTP cyclohydrolase I